MGKGANQKLLQNAGAGRTNSDALQGKGSGLSDFLTPKLESEYSNPEGYTPQQQAYMRTASEQSVGGGVSATTGQANLETARTRNAGGFQGAVGTANRGAQRQLSENALKVETDNAQLQQQQKQQALQSLMSLYGIDEQTALGYLNSSNSALGAENQSHPNQEGIGTAGKFIANLEGRQGQ